MLSKKYSFPDIHVTEIPYVIEITTGALKKYLHEYFSLIGLSIFSGKNLKHPRFYELPFMFGTARR